MLKETEEIDEKDMELFLGFSVLVGDSKVLEFHEEELFSEFDCSTAMELLNRFGQELNWCSCISFTESNSMLQPKQHVSETIFKQHLTHLSPNTPQASEQISPQTPVALDGLTRISSWQHPILRAHAARTPSST